MRASDRAFPHSCECGYPIASFLWRWGRRRRFSGLIGSAAFRTFVKRSDPINAQMDECRLDLGRRPAVLALANRCLTFLFKPEILVETMPVPLGNLESELGVGKCRQQVLHVGLVDDDVDADGHAPD